MATEQRIIRLGAWATLVGTAVLVASACNASAEPTRGAPSAAPPRSAAIAPAPVPPGVRLVTIEVTDSGYVPSTIEAKKGEKLVVRFTRRVDSECLREVEFPELKVKKELPLNTPVDFPVTLDHEGKIPFQCGMAMVKGAIEVKP